MSLPHGEVQKLARALIHYYREEVVPDLVEEFDSWGFNAATLKQDDDAFFAFVVLASYDRRPFTYHGGYEAIWSEDPGSVRRLLDSKRLLRRGVVLTRSVEELRHVLSSLVFNGWRLAYDRRTRVEEGVDYARALLEIAQHTTELKSMCLSATDWRGVLAFHERLLTVHGIGPTIASKLVKYLLREIRLAEVPPSAFARISRNLLPEFHNARFLTRLDAHDPASLGRRIATEVELLGDPLAIDGMFHADKFYDGEIPAKFVEAAAAESA